MPRVLHFADAHIDMANYGRHDPESGLPYRVLDFLKSLDSIIDAALLQKVDMVIFAGDAYKDRNPAPTFQREWGKRIMRLSRAQIPTLLLVGNHDLSPALGRAHAMEAFDTLDVPYVQVIDKPMFLTPKMLENVPVQVIAIPWMSRSALISRMGLNSAHLMEINQQMELRLCKMVDDWLEESDPNLPVILTAHASVQGAQYGAERTVMLGSDMVLSSTLVKDPRLDYVAMGHIHRPQEVNKGSHPPVVYPGSIERVDFGEVNDEKFFVIANIERGRNSIEWYSITTIRPMIDCFCQVETNENVMEQIFKSLPNKDELSGAIVRLVLEYPRDWEGMIDEAAIHDYADQAFELHLVKKPQSDTRLRLPEDKDIGFLSPMELLKIYWDSTNIATDQIEELQEIAAQIIKSNE